MCKRILILLLGLLSTAIYAKTNPDDIIIQVNGRKIRTQEFSERLNGLPSIGTSDVNEIKENLLCTLIAETILSFEAEKMRLDTSAQFRRLSHEYSNEALYEQWMNSEVRKPVKVSDDELKKAYKRFRQERFVEYWTFSSQAEARKFTADAAKGVSSSKPSELKKIEFGKSLEEVEDLIYNLKENEMSRPVFVDSLYYIFKLIKTSPHPEYSKQTFPYWMETIEKIIRDRKENLVLDQKFSELMKGQDFTIKKDAYNFLVNQLYPTIYDKDQLKYKQPEEIQLALFNKEVKTDDMFNQPLVIFKQGRQWTVRDLWNKLSVCPYPLNYKNPEDLKPGLLDVIRRIIMFESVTSDAAVKNYGNTDFVQAQSAMWSDNLRALSILSKYRKSVNISESELIKLYERTKRNMVKPEMRRIIPLIVKDKKLAEDLYKQISQGADLLELAEKYSINKTGTSKNSPGLFITRDYWGEIGPAAFSLKPGEISGVISCSDTNYAIVKVLEIQGAAPITFEEARTKLSLLAEGEKLQQEITELLSEKAGQYKVRINREAVKNVEYFNGNIGVKKTHFPLRNLVPSIPVFDHNAKWYKDLLSGK